MMCPKSLICRFNHNLENSTTETPCWLEALSQLRWSLIALETLVGDICISDTLRSGTRLIVEALTD